jgi:hypothetical protein
MSEIEYKETQQVLGIYFVGDLRYYVRGGVVFRITAQGDFQARD